jgi:hypothetical protein
MFILLSLLAEQLP